MVCLTITQAVGNSAYHRETLKSNPVTQKRNRYCKSDYLYRNKILI